MRVKRYQIIAALATTSAALGHGQTALPDFGALTLDQLTNIKITSFNGKEQKLSQVAGAVYVITKEQIERSGLTSVPELLRLAPGIDVARINGNQWSVSARGPVGAYANKLLVLIDGRSVYSPIFSGTYWESGMPVLENIDRIEVIRGPGATIWGANAVLGVVNIITKNAAETHGTTVTAGAGNSAPGFGNVTTGGALGSTSYRVYFGGLDQSALRDASGADADDGLSDVQGGFRLDGTHKRDTWMVEGDLFRGAENNTGLVVSLAPLSNVRNPALFNAYAGNLSGEWRRRVGKTGEIRLTSYFDHASRHQPQYPAVAVRTWDTELQYDVKAGQVHNLSLGGGERLISENVKAPVNTGPAALGYSSVALTYVNVNAFAQDEMHFLRDKLLVTVGAKLERTHFGGWGAEPSANLLWAPGEHHSFWISGARSLRTPSLVDGAFTGPITFVSPSVATGGLPLVVLFTPSPAFSSESVNDFEAGYRGQISKAFSLDLAVFYDQFSDLRSSVAGNPTPGFSTRPFLFVPQAADNGAEGRGRGAEGSLAWKVFPVWKMEGSYTYNAIDTWLGASAAPGSTVVVKVPPRNKWRLQSYLNLSKSWQLDTLLYWSSAGDPTNVAGPSILIPSYTRLDVRLGYKVGPHWQFSLAGQNLLQSRHLEAAVELLSIQSYVNRGVYLKSTWRF